MLAALIGFRIAKRFLSPIRRITACADEIAGSDLSRRVPEESTKGELTRTLNRMLSSLEDSFRRARRFTSDASHELRAGRGHPRIRRKPARKRFPALRRIQDTQPGLRAFTCDRIPFMPEIRGSRYEYEMNVPLECARKGVIIRDVPIETVHIDENASSHFHRVRDAFRIYREIFAFAASSFAGFLVNYGLFSLLSALLGQSMPGVCNVLAHCERKRKLRAESSIRISRSKRRNVFRAAILCVNTLLLKFLVNVVCINRFAAEIFVEIVLFVAGWTIQKFAVFAKRCT